MGNILGDFIDQLGTVAHLPEFGISEWLAGGNTTNTGNPNAMPISVMSPMATGGSNATKPTGTDSRDTQLDLNNTNTTNQDTSAADERAAYDDQIRAINQLLGVLGTQKSTGLVNLDTTYNTQKSRMNQDYDEQETKNSQNKQKGVEQVDQFAYDSFNNLRRLLQGANAGNSSVARELMPYLVSKSATGRRQGVFETAGENAQALTKGRRDEGENLDNQYGSQKQSFLDGILNKENDLLSQRRGHEIQKAMANGTGYQAARAAGDASLAQMDDRTAQLQNLFAQFKPTFNTKALPGLNTYTMDKAAISADQSLPQESRYYQSQLKKKQEMMA